MAKLNQEAHSSCCARSKQKVDAIDSMKALFCSQLAFSKTSGEQLCQVLHQQKHCWPAAIDIAPDAAAALTQLLWQLLQCHSKFDTCLLAATVCRLFASDGVHVYMLCMSMHNPFGLISRISTAVHDLIDCRFVYVFAVDACDKLFTQLQRV